MSLQNAILAPQDDALVRAEINGHPRIEQRLVSAEEQLLHSQRALVDAMTIVRNSHDELLQVQLQLIDTERMETAGTLGVGVAHDLKNFLAVLGFGTDYLTKRLENEDENIHKSLHAMRDSVARALAIVRGLVDFSAPRKLEFKALDISAVIEPSLLLSQHEFLANHVVVYREMAQGLPTVEVDDFKMSQVFVNLFINAAHAMSLGGILTIRTYAGPGAVVVTEIDDTGHGIPPHNLDQIFEPFFTTKSPGKGNGLGLSVVRQVVTLHGGTIDIRNREGGGVSVTVTLPERQPEPATACELPCGTGLRELAGPRHSEGVYHP